MADGTGSFGRWLPGRLRPGDELTKFTSNQKLSELGSSGMMCLIETEDLRQERAAMRETTRARKEAKKAEAEKVAVNLASTSTTDESARTTVCDGGQPRQSCSGEAH